MKYCDPVVSKCWARRVLVVLLPLVFACASWPGGASGTDPAASAQANEEQPKLVTPTELRFRLERFADGLAEALSSPLDLIRIFWKRANDHKLIARVFADRDVILKLDSVDHEVIHGTFLVGANSGSLL